MREIKPKPKTRILKKLKTQRLKPLGFIGAYVWVYTKFCNWFVICVNTFHLENSNLLESNVNFRGVYTCNKYPVISEDKNGEEEKR